MTMHPATKPSIPSIKLTKFIIPEANMRKIKTTTYFREVFSFNLFNIKETFSLLDKIIDTVNNWKINLIFELIFLQSSISPTIAIGKAKRKLEFPSKRLPIILETVNTIPPPVGFITECELLITGISKIYFLKNGIINFKKNKLLKKVIKAIKIKYELKINISRKEISRAFYMWY